MKKFIIIIIYIIYIYSLVFIHIYILWEASFVDVDSALSAIGH